MADSEARETPESSGRGWARSTTIVRRPHNRHYLTGFVAGSVVKERNSLLEPWVDVWADMEAINAGLGVYDSGTQSVQINGRRYGIHENGRTYPISGEGVLEVERGVYKALLIMRRYNGVNDRSRFEINLNDSISTTDRDDAIRIWRLREKALEHEESDDN